MPAEVFNHATLSALFRYWDEKRTGRVMPARRDIDPIEMGPRLLPHLMLCEFADKGTRIRFRLVGTLLVKRLGFDPTGKWLADLPKSDYLDFLARMVRLSYAEQAPIFA
ncbi:MAG TPA: PAS domain-containing protein, partial [Stellaceae bacterium]|nr:PAS domain-containing protein [Stellaceae bacterium]